MHSVMVCAVPWELMSQKASTRSASAMIWLFRTSGAPPSVCFIIGQIFGQRDSQGFGSLPCQLIHSFRTAADQPGTVERDHLDEIIHSKLPGIPGTDDYYLHGSFHLRKPDSGKDCITFLIR